MFDFMEILSYFAYDLEAVTEYVETLESQSARASDGRLYS